MGHKRKHRGKDRDRAIEAEELETILDSVRAMEACPLIVPCIATAVILDARKSGLEDAIGQRLSGPHLLLNCLMALDLATLAFSFVASVLAFGWWAALVIPALVVAAGIMSKRSAVIPALPVLTVTYCAAGAAGFLVREYGTWPALFAASVPVPWLLHRVIGRVALEIVMRLVLRNERAFAELLKRRQVFLVPGPAATEDPAGQ